MNLNNPEPEGHTKSSVREMIQLINNDPKLLEALSFWEILPEDVVVGTDQHKALLIALQCYQIGKGTL